MKREQDESEQPDAGHPSGSGRLRVVQGPVASATQDEAPPPVRLRREFKGLTVADLEREDVAEQLPGLVKSALEHIERGDLAAAERALPGEFGQVLAGPGHRRRTRYGWMALVGLAAFAAGVLILDWLQA